MGPDFYAEKGQRNGMFEELHRKMNRFWNADRTLNETDPEFIGIFSEFAYDTVVNEPGANDEMLDDHARCMAIIAAIIGAQGMDAFEMMLPISYHSGVTSVELKEIVYEATPLIGFAHTLPYLKRINDYLNVENVELPLAPQSAIDKQNRTQEGASLRRTLFGESADSDEEFRKMGAGHIDSWISGDYLGAYLTRNGLSLQEREMIAFCLLMAQPDCANELRGHIMANLRVGNTAHFLIAVASQCLPYIGYPRAMNAVKTIAEVAHSDKQTV